MDKMTIYNHLPIWGQNLACYLEGRRILNKRYSTTFWKKLHEYEERDSWSYERKCEYRDSSINKMVEYCYKNVPYYHDLLNDGGINPERIRGLEDLKLIPTLNKDIVNKQPERFLSKAFPVEDMITAHTSGTTGAGFIFKTTQEAQCEQWALWWKYRLKLGIEFGTLSGNFGTRFIVPATQSKPPFWRYNSPCHQVYFSAFHEKPEYLKYYIDEIKRQNITWLHGYPSLLTELANEVIRDGDVNLKEQIRFVTIGAESLLDYQKTIMESAYGVHAFQHYGMSEGVSNFSENPNGVIVVDEDYAATEFIKENGITRIIGTNLTNYAMPLLRWETKDTARVRFVPGTGRVVESIDGRVEDYVTLPSGKKIGKLDHVFKDAVHLKEVQLVQSEDYTLSVLYVPRDAEYKKDIEMAKRMFDWTFGEKVDIKFVSVDKIEKSKSGKLRFIMSHVGGNMSL